MKQSETKPSQLIYEFADHYAEKATNGNTINPALYTQYDVKRGLRHADGTGVLVGLTNIGNAHGYVVDEHEKTPSEGRLSYRGYSVGDLITGYAQEKRFGFEEVCYLLLLGDLPTKKQLAEFTRVLGDNRTLPKNFTEDVIMKRPSSDIMNKLARSVLVSYSFDDYPDDISIPNILRQGIRLLARVPAMAAYGYQALAHYFEGQSLYLHAPDPALSTAENFLRMIRSDGEYTRLEAELLDMALILHAEHGGGNNSSFTVHVVASTDTDIYSVMAAAIGSLKGPKHGGANIRVREMVEEMKATIDWRNKDAVQTYLTAVVEKRAYDKSGLIYGMGHAIYTLSDPRAVLLKNKARELAEATDRMDNFNLYDMIEALAPSVLGAKKGRTAPICANVDLYSGLVYDMLGIPPSLYTPIFAMSRMAGWCAHLLEERVSGGKIIRPANKNLKPPATYTPLANR
ncbi:MAG: citrate/2-methylcitrate synthase [Lentisphaerae bacterium]|nr:citrate/2-methylcitrate synthase [Lentisphaerota bacterium]